MLTLQVATVVSKYMLISQIATVVKKEYINLIGSNSINKKYADLIRESCDNVISATTVTADWLNYKKSQKIQGPYPTRQLPAVTSHSYRAVHEGSRLHRPCYCWVT
jgi:hypothetical protein